MVKYEDILKAINASLKTKFPDIPIQSKDITEGFDRPSFFVDFENIKASDLMNFYAEKTLSIALYFFPEDRYKNRLNLLATATQFEEVFLSQPLVVNENFMINITEADSEIVDGVLVFRFEVYAIDEYENHNAGENQEIMEDLQISI